MGNKLTKPPSTTGRKSVYLALIGFIVYAFLFPQYSWADFFEQENAVTDDYSLLHYSDQLLEIGLTRSADDRLMILGGNTLIQSSNPLTSVKTGPHCSSQSRFAVITAYSSSLDETDGSPFVTAAGTKTRDGVIAANFLKFGTRVKIPALYGEKIFVVEDRMAEYNNGRIDIWMPSKSLAIQFGTRRAEIVVLD
jgi:3D (Asp-Asp-Asp) domain-containing protein